MVHRLPDRGTDSPSALPATLPAAVAAQAAARPAAVALRHKRHGIWHALTWRELGMRVERLAQALARRGVAPGDTFVLLTHPCPEALLLALAAQRLGASAVPFDPLLPSGQLHALLAALQPRFVFAQGQAQADQVLAAVPAPALLVYADARGLAQYRQPALVACDALEGGVEEGNVEEGGAPDAATPHQRAFVFYRAAPDGALQSQGYTHRELLAEARALVEHEGLGAHEEALAARAFAAGAVARYLLGSWLVAGFTLNFPENLDTRDNDRRELGPTLVLGTRATYARVAQLALDGLPARGGWLRRAVDAALAPTPGWPARVAGYWLVRRPLREVLGFSRLRVPLLVGEPLDAHADALLRALGIGVHAWPEAHEWQAGAAPARPSGTPATHLHWSPT